MARNDVYEDRVNRLQRYYRQSLDAGQRASQIGTANKDIRIGTLVSNRVNVGDRAHG